MIGLVAGAVAGPAVPPLLRSSSKVIMLERGGLPACAGVGATRVCAKTNEPVLLASGYRILRRLGRCPLREDFVGYLEEHAARHGLPIRFGVELERRRPFDTVPLVTTTPSAAASTYGKRGGHRSAFLTSPLAWCFVLVALEAIVILVGLGVDHAPITGGDGPDFNRVAHNLLFHGVYSSASSPPLLQNITRAPGYPVVLAIFDFLAIHLGIGQVLMVRICQFAMVAVTACLVYGIGREVADEWTARIAGLFTASYLPLLGLASYHLTEVITCLLTTLAVLLLIRLMRRTPDALVTVCGLGLTVAALTYVRPDFAPVLLIVVVALLLTSKGNFRSRERWIRPGIVVGIFIVAVVPWTIRNYDLTGRLVPVSAASGASLLASADQYAGTISDAMTTNDFDKFLHQLSVIDSSIHIKPGPKRDVAADTAYTRAAERIFDRLSVTRIIESIPKREVYLWQPAVFPPNEDGALIDALGWAQYLILLVLGLIGAAVSRHHHTLLRDWPLWILAVSVSLLHLVFHIEGRYSVEARPMLIVFAAIGAVACGRTLRPRLARTRQ
jgi:Dolichyl-phosphate-mannose-protein mannosyltransferase